MHSNDSTQKNWHWHTHLNWLHKDVWSGEQIGAYTKVEGKGTYKNISDILQIYIWKRTYDLDMKTWLLDLIYHSLQAHSFPFSLYFSTLSSKTLSLLSRVGMRFKALYNKCSVVEIVEVFHIITKQKYIH